MNCKSRIIRILERALGQEIEKSPKSIINRISGDLNLEKINEQLEEAYQRFLNEIKNDKPGSIIKQTKGVKVMLKGEEPVRQTKLSSAIEKMNSLWESLYSLERLLDDLDVVSVDQPKDPAPQTKDSFAKFWTNLPDKLDEMKEFVDSMRERFASMIL